MKIFGLAGTNGAGKDTLAELLAQEYEFLSVSATELFLVELNKRGLVDSRTNKSALSAEWRREHGMGVIVDKAVAQFGAAEPGAYKGLIVGSLRHPGETDRVHELGGKQIWVDADPKIRYARISSANRGREAEDNKTYEEFMADEAREMSPEGDAATLNMGAVKEKADISIENNTDDVEEFRQMVRDRLRDYLITPL